MNDQIVGIAGTQKIEQQIQAAEQNVKAFTFAIKKASERRTGYQEDLLRFKGRIEAFGITTEKIRLHMQGVKDDLFAQGKITEESFKEAHRWISEVHGIPNNLIEGARIDFRRTEGSVDTCDKIIADYQEAIKGEQNLLNQLQKAFAAAKAKAEKGSTAGESPPPPPPPTNGEVLVRSES